MSSPQKKYNYHPKPRISVNQIAEYVWATSTRRKRIIRDAKYPQAFIAARYSIAREGIVNFLSNPQRNNEILYNTESKLQAKLEQSTNTPWNVDDYKASIEAIQKFYRSYNELGLNRYDIKPINGRTPKLEIQGVSISINAKLSLHRIDKNKDQRVGSMSVSISKTNSSSKSRFDISQTAATTLYLFTEKYLSDLGLPDPNLCTVIDVFGGNLIKCPRAIKKRIAEINDACEEINERWENMVPPDDYK